MRIVYPALELCGYFFNRGGCQFVAKLKPKGDNNLIRCKVHREHDLYALNPIKLLGNREDCLA